MIVCSNTLRIIILCLQIQILYDAMKYNYWLRLYTNLYKKSRILLMVLCLLESARDSKHVIGSKKRLYQRPMKGTVSRKYSTPLEKYCLPSKSISHEPGVIHLHNFIPSSSAT